MFLNKIKSNAKIIAPITVFVFFSVVFFASAVTRPSAILENPLKGTSSIQQLIVKIAGLAAQVGASLAVVYLILSGFKFVMAQGNPTKVGEARKTFYHAVIGTALILGAWLLAELIDQAIKSLG